MPKITIYKAKKILTMDANCPEATHVAVKDGRILAVGSLEETASWGEYQLDQQFADKVILPGFVEGHTHMMAGGIWDHVYVGFHERIDPRGKKWEALTTIDEVIERLKLIDKDLAADKPLVAWGFDPIFLPTERLNRSHLDQVSTERTIVIIHSNFHLLTTNSAGLTLAGYDRSTDVEGVHKDAKGELTGELQEMAAMFPLYRRINVTFRGLGTNKPSVVAFGSACNLVGVTTATDLHADIQDDDVEALIGVTDDDTYPVRLVPALGAITGSPEEICKKALKYRNQSTDKLRLGIVKVMTDGSIQGFTARIRWPHYLGSHNNGIWNMPPEQIAELINLLNGAGIQMHIHTNGDEASAVTIDAIDAALQQNPFPDHRHTLQHCQMASSGQFRRMKALGICVNLFANHIYYFGDQHENITIGPDRAKRMNACRTALDNGVPLAIHSDAPVTPMGPLTTAWCAVNRITGSGKVLGSEQRISVQEALHAVTLGPAYTLKLDDEIGSIEVGKRADFAILDEDPMSVDPLKIKDIPVWGTVLGGRVYPVN